MPEMYGSSRNGNGDRTEKDQAYQTSAIKEGRDQTEGKENPGKGIFGRRGQEDGGN